MNLTNDWGQLISFICTHRCQMSIIKNWWSHADLLILLLAKRFRQLHHITLRYVMRSMCGFLCDRRDWTVICYLPWHFIFSARVFRFPINQKSMYTTPRASCYHTYRTWMSAWSWRSVVCMRLRIIILNIYIIITITILVVVMIIIYVWDQCSFITIIY